MTTTFVPTIKQRTPPYPGGYPQIPTGGNIPGSSSSFVPLSNGGIVAQDLMALFPCYNAINQVAGFYTFDPTLGFNDPLLESSVDFKVEQPGPDETGGDYRTPTVTRIFLTYTDLGPCTIVGTLTGSNDLQQLTEKKIGRAHV